MFKLYVAGDAQNSATALANLNDICREYLPGRHEIEIVDVFAQPKRALADGIFMTPTLVRLSPSPVRRVVGALTQRDTVLRALGLKVI